MNAKNEEFNPTTEIITKVINEINSGKEKIANIINDLTDEVRMKKVELLNIQERINKVINEVEELELLDKKMRRKLANASKNYDEHTVKEIYEEALEIRVQYITKQSEENELRQRRDELELTLRVHLRNLEQADGMIKQINIALGYLQGDVITALDGFEEDTRGVIGIKILEMQEKERRRIAKDVHDGPAQYIASTLMRMDFCKMLIQKDIEKGLNELDDLKVNVRTALKEIREILYDLRPIYIQEKTLEDSVKEMVNHILRECEIEVEVDIDGHDADLDYIKKVALYRIIQEIVNNVKKHAKATKLYIRGINCKEYVNFIIKDNGIGFNYEDTLREIYNNGNTFGLVGIQDRVNGLQGELVVKSSSMDGTTYKLKIPLRGGHNDKNSDSR